MNDVVFLVVVEFNVFCVFFFIFISFSAVVFVELSTFLGFFFLEVFSGVNRILLL